MKGERIISDVIDWSCMLSKIYNDAVLASEYL